MSDIVCPHCKSLVYDEEALLCHFCGNSLSRTSAGAFGAIRGGGKKWIWIALVLAMLAILLFTMK